jgi:hypothetical protein
MPRNVTDKQPMQLIIDKYLEEFYKTHKLTVPIELHPYLHRMLQEVESKNLTKKR